MTPVFIALVDLKPLQGCDIDPEEYNGVAVRCYIPAENEKNARSLFIKVLEECKFELIEEEFFVQEDLVEWENPDSEEATTHIQEARDTMDVVFSEFSGWDHDDPDAR
ncbi:hypothetical protein [Colwellia psychrerythraea]|uniref:Uncharacterized protein n=1 Tax=Colwellia psychrerythraea TaxID=28229 RepID=A0A099KCY4_COLPS|nr:hypothetical protein [Colwellia psychrerythraea]KGJ88216.1 hypothetical protein GAB14E_4245 [Colwellia psychrerythraea]